MAEDRKVFPVGQVLELVTGKNDADVSSLVAFITGRANPGPEAAKAAAPFAFAWLARWYPRFMDMEWKDDQSWEAYLRQASHILGDNVSLEPMSGRFKNIVNTALDAIEDSQASLASQTERAMKLEQEVKSLQPLQGLVDAARKKSDDLEAKLKSMKSEMLALNRKVLEFEGKVAMDHDELMQNIQSAIKDGLKGMAFATGTAAAAAPASEAGTPQEAEKQTPEDEWGFGSGSSSSDDEFGF